MKAKPKAEAAKPSDKTADKGKKPMMCSHYGRFGHSHENCFFLHPKKRPGASRVRSDLVKFLQAKVAELKKKIVTMASLGQVADVWAPMKRHGSSSTMDAFILRCMVYQGRCRQQWLPVLRLQLRWWHRSIVVVHGTWNCQIILGSSGCLYPSALQMRLQRSPLL